MLTYIIHVLYNGYTYIAIRVYVCGMTHAHVYYMTVDSTETNMVLLEINSRKKNATGSICQGASCCFRSLDSYLNSATDSND